MMPRLYSKYFRVRDSYDAYSHQPDHSKDGHLKFDCHLTLGKEIYSLLVQLDLHPHNYM